MRTNKKTRVTFEGIIAIILFLILVVGVIGMFAKGVDGFEVNFINATGGSSQVQIVNISSVSSGDSWIDVFNGNVISWNEPLDCGAGNYIYGFNNDGTVKCRSQTALNPFDQSLNTTDSVEFDNVTANNFFGFINWSWIQNIPSFLTQAVADNLYYPLSNPSSYYNSTSLQNVSQLTNNAGYIATETDPRWTGNSTLVPYLANNNNFTGNNSLSITNFNIYAGVCPLTTGQICRNSTGVYFS
jgi:hypothetical protein